MFQELSYFGITLLIFAHLVTTVSPERLNRYIRHYESLNYDTSILHRKHERTRRSVSHQFVDLSFNSHGRDFHLSLKRGAPHFSKNLIVETNQGAFQYEPDHLYVGKLKDEPNSRIHGSIINGRFGGTIYTEDGEEYHVESAKHHFKQTPDFHSIVYKTSDIDWAGHSGCAAKKDINKRMEDIQKSAVISEDENWQAMLHHSADNKYSNPNKRSSRRKRASDELNTCHLYLQADHTYTNHFKEDGGGDEGAFAEVLASFNDHVTHVNQIYTNQQFAYEGNLFRDIGFSVERIRINTTDDIGPSNPFSVEYIGVEKFLELNSLQDHSDYCLAYVFADRDFNDGVLGLAWVGSPDSKISGGICEKHKTFLGGIQQSLNTGIVTIQNYGSTVPNKVSYITFAHELGHNFGSPHDYPTRCQPGGLDGNYIMYPSATSGDKINNNRFSDCSVENITRVLAQKSSCFVSSDRAVCGNRILDEGEQCDCGYEDQCTDDPCCVPRFNSEGNPQASQSCMFRDSNAQCSPSLGPCCNSSCLFIESSDNHVCRVSSECAEESVCDGTMASCPVPQPVSNTTLCNLNRQICLSGTCSGSLCSYFGFEECFCTPEDSSLYDQKCHLCCIEGGVCKSSSEIESMASHAEMYGQVAIGDDTETKVLFQQPGAPCNDFNGYCDVFYKCRDVDSNGPLSRLTKAIFNPDLYQNIAAWIQEYWWAAVLIGLGVVILMALFIKCCSVHTPSSNPNMPQARKVSYYSNTLRRRPRTGAVGMEMN